MWLQGQRAVGAALAEARRRAGLTQVQVAKRLSKPQSFISNYEKGHRRIDVLEMLRIASVLKAEPQQILGDVIRGLKSGRSNIRR